jgi:hypothetical protein
MSDWEEDCLREYGEILSGKYKHWCPEWDNLPIDETCQEFESCCCFEDICLEWELSK